MSDVDFSFPIRIYVEDTDAGGIVYYVNYLKFMERSRTELMRSLGFEQSLGLDQSLDKRLDQGLDQGLNKNSGSDLEEPANFQFVVHSADAKFLKPAKLNMELFSSLRVKKVAKTYLVFDQWIEDSDQQIYCQAEIKIACIDNAIFKPRAMPKLVKEGFDIMMAAKH